MRIYLVILIIYGIVITIAYIHSKSAEGKLTIMLAVLDRICRKHFSYKAYEELLRELDD